MKKMYPTFSAAIRPLLLHPVGTATVERSFSTLHRILSSERCCLTADHIRHLMFLLVEGPQIPDVQDATEQQNANFEQFVNEAICAGRRNLVGEHGLNFCSCYCHSSHNIQFEN